MHRFQTTDLIRIAGAGGGFVLNGKRRTVADLVQIAAAAREGGGRVTLTGMSTMSVEELVRIAEAGKGFVAFAD